MGAQNIIEISRDYYYDKFRAEMCEFAELQYMKDKFMLGKGADRDMVRHAQMFVDALNYDDFEIIDYIQDRMNQYSLPTIKECGFDKKVNYCGDLELEINNYYGQFWSQASW